MVKTIPSRSSSQVPEQVDDKGMRDRKAVHTIRVSCYHKEKGVYPDVRTGSSNTLFFLPCSSSSSSSSFFMLLAPDLRLSLGQRNIRSKPPLNISIIFGHIPSNRQISIKVGAEDY